MSTKSKTSALFLLIGAFVIGFCAGAFIGLPGTGDNLASGDVSKVNSFRKSTASSTTSTLEQKLKSDTLAFNNESATVELISTRMSEFANLVDCAIKAAGDKEELSEEVNALKNVRELSENALQTAKVASASLESLSTGEKNDLAMDYDQASKNLLMAFLLVDRQVQLGKQFVVAVDKYLEGKSADDAPELVRVRDLWANYCGESAWLNGDKQEVAYWENKSTIDTWQIATLGNHVSGNFGGLSFGGGSEISNMNIGPDGGGLFH